MLKQRQEWDSDSYRRRFGNTYCVVQKRNEDDGEVVGHSVVYVQNIDMENIMYRGPDKNEIIAEMALVHPVYYPFRTGFHRNLIANDKPCLIIKNLKKLYCVGMSKNSHTLYGFYKNDGELSRLGFGDAWPDFINDFEADVPKALKSFGPISDVFWISNRYVYYLTTRIGMRKGSNFYVSPLYYSEVMDCLKEHQCKVSC